VIILDTHALIWMASDPKRLTSKAREAIREARQESEVAIAAITLWEMAWLAENGRIQVVGSVESFVRDTADRVVVRPITPEIAALAVRLASDFPKDPSDRLIAATAIVEGALLVTADQRMRKSNVVKTVW